MDAATLLTLFMWVTLADGSERQFPDPKVFPSVEACEAAGEVLSKQAYYHRYGPTIYECARHYRIAPIRSVDPWALGSIYGHIA